MRTLRKLWSIDLGWWTVPLAAGIATLGAAIAVHTLLHPLQGEPGAYVAVNVDWSRSLEFGLLAGLLSGLAATYTELRAALARRVAARQLERVR
jgi:H+/gluconate symporter-like permease